MMDKAVAACSWVVIKKAFSEVIKLWKKHFTLHHSAEMVQRFCAPTAKCQVD